MPNSAPRQRSFFEELDVVGIDAQVPKRDQGLSCGQYLLLAALNRCSRYQ